MADRELIRKIALENGFKLKTQPDGTEDLNPYVYDFASALIAEEQSRSDAVWETLVKIADALDIDYQEARKEVGKPSDVFIRHIKGMESTIERLEAQVEQMGEIIRND